MPLQLKTGHLAYTATNHLALCTESCPGLGDVDWYLYLCNPASLSSWCPTANHRATAINLGTLSAGSNTVGLSGFSCNGELFELFCNSPTDDDSCTRDFTFSNVGLLIVAGGSADAWAFDFDLYADVSTTDCNGNAFNLSAHVLATSRTITSATGYAAECNAGVYAAGRYSHRNVAQSVLNCDGGLATGAHGLYIDPNTLDIYPTDFFVAPLASMPSC